MKQTTERTKTMKKLLFTMLATFALVSLFVGCESASEKVRRQREEKAEVETEKERLERLMAEAEKSPEVETELFLGFKFGMTEKQVDSVFTDLESKGIRKNRWSDECILKIGGEDIGIKIHTSYYDGKLYDVLYEIKGSGIDSLQGLFIQSERYRENNFEKISQSGKYITFDSYIKDNLLIAFAKETSYLNEGFMRYTNIPVARRVKREKEEKERKQKEQDKAKEEKLKSMF